MRVFCRPLFYLLLTVILVGPCGAIYAQQGMDLQIAIVDPMTSREEPGGNGVFTIRWVSSEFGMVRLFRDSDNEPGGEIEISPFAIPSNMTSFEWDTSTIPNMTEWYIVGKISIDGQGPWTGENEVSYSTGTVYVNRFDEPVIFIDEPSTDQTADRIYTITYRTRGVGSYFWLKFDTDRQPGGEGSIVGPLFAESLQFEETTYNWSTKDLPHGEAYYVTGKASRTQNIDDMAFEDWSTGRVIIDHSQDYHVDVLKPDRLRYVRMEDTFTVTWDDGDPNVPAYVYVYTDTDVDQDPTDDVNRSLLPMEVSNTSNQFPIPFGLQSGDLPGNTYYIIVRIKESEDGETLAEGYAKGTITLMAQEQDNTPPGAVYDLVARPWSGDSTANGMADIKLSWTAPGDDGNTGQATSYDIRYSTTPIANDADFEDGTSVTYTSGAPVGRPSASGAEQFQIVKDLLLNTGYYFALKTIDDRGLTSSMSNVAWENSMPVELSSFEAIPGLGRIALRWTTASETNALGWHVARCDEANGGFNTITEKLIAAAGTSAEPHNYNHLDNDVLTAMTYYYKLILFNTDGTKEESHVISCSPLGPQVNILDEPHPLVLAGGLVGSEISSKTGGSLTVMAVCDPYTGSGLINRVELYYMGIPAGILLYDDGTNGDDVAGDNVFHVTMEIGPGLAAGDYLLEIVATDTDGNQSPMFPYITVR